MVFQAGVIFAAAVILHALLFGVDTTESVVPLRVLKPLTAIGVLLYAGVGVAGLFMGGNYLDYNVLASTPTGGQHLGILLVELGVGITVASVMVLLFFCFAGMRAQDTNESASNDGDFGATESGTDYDHDDLRRAYNRARFENVSDRKEPSI